jgi:hypothetical protein
VKSFLSVVGALLGVSALVVACGGSGGGSAGPVDNGGADGGSGGEGGVVANGITFHKHIEPILQDHCQGCHAPGGIAPMPLLTYKDAQTFAGGMQEKAATRAMPPWGARAQASCKPRFGFKSDPSLTDAQIKLFADWVAGGSPEGDPKDAPPVKAPVDIGLKNPTQSNAPTAPYALKGQSDQFRCFVLDPKLATDQYLTGYDITPGNKTIVHHALIFSAAAGEIKQTLDASGSYDCFGGPGLANPKLIAAWAPGTGAVVLPANVGLPLKAGTQFVMQVHYHPHSSADMSPDSTKFSMVLTGTKPEYTFDPELIGNFGNPLKDGTGLLADPDDRNGAVEFRIPANSTAHTETQQFTLPAALVTPPGGGAPITPQILAVGAHMHLVGVAEEVTVKHANPINGDPAEECLLSVPQWDFNWQRAYQYDTDISKLPYYNANDVLTIKCHYDNTMKNKALASSILEQGMKGPIDVVLGETTLDEMCLGVIGFVYKL